MIKEELGIYNYWPLKSKSFGSVDFSIFVSRPPVKCFTAHAYCLTCRYFEMALISKIDSVVAHCYTLSLARECPSHNSLVHITGIRLST